MQQFKGILGIVILSVLLVSCQNVNLNISEAVTSIEVYEWNGEELITTIDDEELIAQLVHELDTAETYSTANIDWALPDYKLLIKHDNEVLYEMGYCNDVQNFGDGAVGRYWEFDKLYGVSTPLPIQ